MQAFVDFFSRGLQAEYKSKGIIIQVDFYSYSYSKQSRVDALFQDTKDVKPHASLIPVSLPPPERSAVFCCDQAE